MKKIFSSIGIFILVFLIYHVGFGCNAFPVDEATNTLMAPDWYPIVGIALSAGSAWIFSRCEKREKGNNSDFTFSEEMNHRNNVTITRKKQIAGAIVKHKIYFDGEYIGKLENGKEMVIGAPIGSHNVSVKGVLKQECHIRFVVSDIRKTICIFDELDLRTSNIKLSITPNSVENKDFHPSESSDVSQPEFEKFTMSSQKKIEKSTIPVKDRDPLDVIRLMEKRFEEQYQYSFRNLLTQNKSMELYEKVVNEFSGIELPLMSQIRFEQLKEEYKEKFSYTNPLIVVDQMEGPVFEEWCAELLRKNGFINVAVTPTSGDQGVDIIAVKDDIRYAIQCKRYAADLGNSPIQEVSAGKHLYHCQVGAVMTNRHFTSGAKKLADATGTLLWDREKLLQMIRIANEK